MRSAHRALVLFIGNGYHADRIADSATEAVDLLVIGLARVRIEHGNRRRHHQRCSRADALRRSHGHGTQTISEPHLRIRDGLACDKALAYELYDFGTRRKLAVIETVPGLQLRQVDNGDARLFKLRR